MSALRDAVQHALDALKDTGADGRVDPRDAADYLIAALALPDAEPVTPPKAERATWQRKAIGYGFEYWRAPDAHGVTGTEAQAIELLEELLGVEVEIEQPSDTTQPAIAPEPLPPSISVSDDVLDMAYINSLPQPFIGRTLNGGNWPINDFEVASGMIRIDVCGLLEVKTISDFTSFRDGDGVEHPAIGFYSDATQEERAIEAAAHAKQRSQP